MRGRAGGRAREGRRDVDLGPVEETVSSSVWRALEASSAELTRLGIPHALIGGLAVGAHGYPRGTKDVGFLVADSAFEITPSGFVLLAPGVPIESSGVRIDTLGANHAEGFLNEAIEDAVVTTEGIAVVRWPVLAYLKVKAGRARDRSDIIELAKAGADARAAAAYVQEHAPQLLPKLMDWFAEAAREED